MSRSSTSVCKYFYSVVRGYYNIRSIRTSDIFCWGQRYYLPVNLSSKIAVTELVWHDNAQPNFHYRDLLTLLEWLSRQPLVGRALFGCVLVSPLDSDTVSVKTKGQTLFSRYASFRNFRGCHLFLIHILLNYYNSIILYYRTRAIVA